MNKLLLDVIEIDLGLPQAQEILTVYVNVYDNSLSRKWLAALNNLIKNNYHLEKNYCFLGFADSARNGEYLLKQINQSISAINSANIGYTIDDHFTLDNSVVAGDEVAIVTDTNTARRDVIPGDVDRDHFNQLHRYFEDLQGVSGQMSPYYEKADATTRWHIRQLNLLCHEFESWQLSWKKKYTAAEWQRPSQLMCWLQAPRFVLDDADYELFGIETMNRSLGGVYVGVNKAIGKHHWEVFVDEANYNPDMVIDNLTTTTMRSQLEAAGDFDIEWANNPGTHAWQKKHLADFKTWLERNGFDSEDKTLTIGHPQVGQVNLVRSFGTEDYRAIWARLNTSLNVTAIRTSEATVTYPYNWSDTDYMQQQIQSLQGR